MLTIQFRLLGNGQWPNISITLPSATLSILTEGFVVGEVDIIASVYDNEHSRLSHYYSKYVRNDLWPDMRSDAPTDCLLDPNAGVTGTIHIRSAVQIPRGLYY